jgi:hypothetical protein
VEAFTAEGKYQTGNNRIQYAPGLVKVVEPKDNGIPHPIPFAKHAFHPG